MLLLNPALCFSQDTYGCKIKAKKKKKRHPFKLVYIGQFTVSLHRQPQLGKRFYHLRTETTRLLLSSQREKGSFVYFYYLLTPFLCLFINMNLNKMATPFQAQYHLTDLVS